MRILFLGGDKRQLEIIKHLALKGHIIDAIGYDKIQLDDTINKMELDNLNISDYTAVIFPVNGVKDDYSITCEFSSHDIILSPDLLVGLDDKSLVFTGIRTKSLNKMLDCSSKKAIALMEENDVKRENSIPTVEGIIGDLVFNTDYTINGSSIFVLGYGNVGKELTKKLKALGASLTVGVINIDEFEELKSNNVSCIYTNNRMLMEHIMQDSDVIINTVPEVIINRDYLKIMNKDVYVLDIASHPHGVDFKAAEELQIRNKLFLGIPSVVAPKTAGQILVNKINSILERSKE